MSGFGNDPYACDVTYEGADFFEVSDWKGMLTFQTDLNVVLRQNADLKDTPIPIGHLHTAGS